MDTDPGELQNGSLQAGSQRHHEGALVPLAAGVDGSRPNGAGPGVGDNKGSAGADAEEGGLRSMLIRIEYDVAQPESGIKFWGKFAHTDNQVTSIRTACCTAAAGCYARYLSISIFSGWAVKMVHVIKAVLAQLK
jgi:hypothetical protein